MDERTLIRTYFDRPTGAAGGHPEVLLGIGDDAAILRPEPGYDLVVAIDTLVEGTHFPQGTPARAIGHRSLAVNLSDLAAMAAEPRWAVLALAMPEAGEAWIREFADGLFALADRHGVALVGGDTVRGPLAATVTVHGRVRPGLGVRRSGAQPGDGIWVTGHPGDAVAGRLQLVTARERGGHESGQALEQTLERTARPLVERFLFPEPRVREGRDLASLATAMLDVSDGLHDDLGKLMEASDTGADLDIACLPLSAALRAVYPANAIQHALTGGDDYELCFTVPEANEARLAAVAAAWPVPVTRIGTVAAETGVRWSLAGKPHPVGPAWQHF
ncbi:MAG: thiamine-phosphate kinase [Gammaproteobacteria bacterium PRO9]|nr:thiamine-phosphate kinase [Gammaproteobacteria bacterium PRO9]